MATYKKVSGAWLHFPTNHGTLLHASDAQYLTGERRAIVLLPFA
jgi:hypothetical protein